ncbi:SDR family oxidoreductase [Thermodesulfobacteriota bacterium]
MLKDKVAVVTGSVRGIGRGIALKLADQHAKLVIDDKDASLLDETVRLIEERGGIATGIVADISKKADAGRIMNTAAEKFGRLDILVNNAGIFQGALVEDMSEEQWDRVIDVDLKGAFLCTQAAIPYMRRIKYGRVINISSADAIIGGVGMVNYAAAKAGIFGLTASVAKEFSRWVKTEGCTMTCNCVIVGYNRTPLVEEDFPDEIREFYPGEIPLGRLSDPEEDVGSVVAFLASEKAGYLTGAKLPVNGGLHVSIAAYG